MMDKREELQGLPVLESHIKLFISSTEGFEKRFFENMVFYITQEAAYEATERQYEFVVGKRKYSSFNSFRTLRDRRTIYRREKTKKQPRHISEKTGSQIRIKAKK